MKLKYVGSAIGLLASIIGIITVFFPSLLNLEKKEILTYKAVIINTKQADDFYNFLDKKLKSDDIFKLDVEICIPYERLDPIIQSSNDGPDKYPHVDSVIPFAPKEMQKYLYAFSKSESNMSYIYPIYGDFIPSENEPEKGTILLNHMKDENKQISEYGYNAWTGYQIPGEYIFDYYEYEINSNCYETLKKELGRNDFGNIDILQLKGYYTKEKELNKSRYEWINLYILKNLSNSEVNLKNQ